MSKQATKEYTEKMRERYQAMLTKKAKGRILDDFCETTGLERKHAIKVMRSRQELLRPAGRTAVYAGAEAALAKIWMMFDQPCSKLLYPVLESYLASYEKQVGLQDQGVRALLLRMSPSTMDRLLRGHRVRTSLWRGHGGPIAAMKRQIPVRSERWEGRGLGWFETDTVAHCGGSMEGSFAYTLTFTDTDSQWTELRAVWNRSGSATTQRISEIEQALPFAVKGVNSDNGPEFLNGHLIRHFKEREVLVLQTRSRPYRKNDNAHVEQKNSSHVRPLLGYDRFEDPACAEALNEILILHSCWMNLFHPCMKLVAKIRMGHRYKKTYDRPRTPAQRVLESPGVSQKTRARITTLLKAYDCYQLKRRVQDKTQMFFERFVNPPIRPLRNSGTGSGPSALRAAPAGTGPTPAPELRRSHHRRRGIPHGAKAAQTQPVSVSSL